MTSSFATCDFCDEHKNDTDGAFRVLPPVFRDFGKRVKFSGQVSTVKCFEDNTLVKAAVDSPGNGRVLVVDGGASLRRALVGGNLGKSAAKNGWAGVIVDGCVRDVAELAECDVGIRALGSMPLPTFSASTTLTLLASTRASYKAWNAADLKLPFGRPASGSASWYRSISVRTAAECVASLAVMLANTGAVQRVALTA